MRKRSLWVKLLAVVFVLAIAVAISIQTGWVALPSAKDSARLEARTATAQRRVVEPRLLLSGEVTPAFQVEIKSEVGGKVKEMHVTAGQVVRKGDVLATIDDTDLLNEKAGAETEVEGAQLSVDKTRGNFERARSLFREKLISKEVFANLEADFKISENALQKSQRRLQSVLDRLSKTRILSPADGTILDVYVNEGQVVIAAASVNAGTPIMLFADLSRLLILTHVNQVDAVNLTPGREMLVRFSENDSGDRKAKIEFIAPVATVKNNIKGFEVQATISGEESRLKPGMSVSMEVPVGRAEGVVTVPVSAVFRENDERVVYVRKGDSVQKRKVSVGLTDLSRAEIKSGLEEGEEILLVEPVSEPPGKS